MNDFYEHIDEHNPEKESKVLILLDDMISDLIRNKICASGYRMVYLQKKKIHLLFAFITQFYSVVSKKKKKIRLNSTYYFTVKILILISKNCF